MRKSGRLCGASGFIPGLFPQEQHSLSRRNVLYCKQNMRKHLFMETEKRKDFMGALTGLKILDFSTLLPGPYATLTLADLGAEEE